MSVTISPRIGMLTLGRSPHVQQGRSVRLAESRLLAKARSILPPRSLRVTCRQRIKLALDSPTARTRSALWTMTDRFGDPDSRHRKRMYGECWADESQPLLSVFRETEVVRDAINSGAEALPRKNRRLAKRNVEGEISPGLRKHVIQAAKKIRDAHKAELADVLKADRAGRLFSSIIGSNGAPVGSLKDPPGGLAKAWERWPVSLAAC